MIYENYHSNISNGLIDLNNVNFSAYVVDETYEPKESDKKADVTGRIETLVKVLVEGDITTLTMSEIIEKITSKLNEEERAKASGFVCENTHLSLITQSCG